MTNQAIKDKDYFIANLMYMGLAIVFIGASFAMHILDVPFKLSIVIIQYGIVLLPILMVTKLQGYSIKERFKLKKISFMTGLKALLLTLFALPMAWTLNIIVNIILAHLGILLDQSMPLGSGTGNYFIILFLISLSPGICEEVFFRGFMLSGYEQVKNRKKTILMTGILFGIFHFNLQNLLLPTFLGFVFAWLVYETGSIFTSMIGHTAFNAIGATVSYMSANSAADPAAVEDASQIMVEQGHYALIFFGIITLIATPLMIMVGKSIKRDHIKFEKGDQLIIKERLHTVESLEDGVLEVVVEEETKHIKVKQLKNLDYKVNKVPQEELIEARHSIFNPIFISVVLAMYVFLMASSYL